MPAGLDTEDLIGALSNAPIVDIQKSDIYAQEDLVFVLRNNNGDDEAVEAAESQPTLLEDEQAWLSNLRAEIEQSKRDSIDFSLHMFI